MLFKNEIQKFYFEFIKIHMEIYYICVLGGNINENHNNDKLKIHLI